MQLTLKTILNRKEKHQFFIYKDVRFAQRDGVTVVEAIIVPRKGSQGQCSSCGQCAPGYDRLSWRSFQHVSVLGLQLYFIYQMRRLSCPNCGIKVEEVPWAEGKNALTTSYCWHLSEWAKLLSIEEVARRFKLSWYHVFTAMSLAVAWGKQRVELENISAIGIDEIYWAKGKFMTLVYQIDNHCKRLIWCGEKRTEETIRGFFDWFGQSKSEALKFVCTDMWKSYLKLVKEKAINALNILDRFHIHQKLNEAIDVVRASEVRALKAKGKEVILRKARYCLLKNPENLKGAQKIKMRELLASNLKSIRAYLYKEDFRQFWSYRSATWASKFFDQWCKEVMLSKIEPLKKVAKTLRSHKGLIMNWFEAKEQLSLGAVEGQNNKAKVVIRKSYGFKTAEMLKIMLFHKLGRLPVPEVAHRYF